MSGLLESGHDLHPAHKRQGPPAAQVAAITAQDPRPALVLAGAAGSGVLAARQWCRAVTWGV